MCGDVCSACYQQHNTACWPDLLLLQAELVSLPGTLGDPRSSRSPQWGGDGRDGRQRPGPASSRLLGAGLFPSDRNMPKVITHLPTAGEAHLYQGNLAFSWFSRFPYHAKKCSTVSKLTFFHIFIWFSPGQTRKLVQKQAGGTRYSYLQES